MDAKATTGSCLARLVGRLRSSGQFSDGPDGWVAASVDAINDRYGEYDVTPSLMLGTEEQVIDRIAFGGVTGLENLYH